MDDVKDIYIQKILSESNCQQITAQALEIRAMRVWINLYITNFKVQSNLRKPWSN